jgi:hypothetical protein
MNAVELAVLVRKNSLVRCNFLGVFSIDTIPNLTSFPSSYIVNCCPQFLRGIHWFAIFAFNRNRVYFFDSFGRPAPSEINDRYKIVHGLKRPVQSIYSSLCGLYCALFIYLCTIGCDLSTVFLLLRNKSDKQIKSLCHSVYDT